MPVTEQTPVVSHSGNGVTTVFAYNFKILAAADIEVSVDGVVKTLTTDYSVSGVGADGGGNVTMVSPPASGTGNVVLRRNMAYKRTAYDYQEGGDFMAETIDADIDSAVMMLQQLDSELTRAVKLPVGTVANQEIAETAAERADKLLGFDSAGNLSVLALADASVVTVTPFAESLLDDTDAAAARATLGIGTDKINDFRLTLTSGLPVTINDVTAASTIYCTPKTGNLIALYDGSNWNLRQSAEFSKALVGLTSGKPYDVFCYDNAGTPTLEFLVWTNDTTRATELVRQDGVLVKSGDATRRYLGSFYSTSTTTTEDSNAKRYLWNYYHRADRMITIDLGNINWTYTTNTLRLANNDANAIAAFMVGVSEDVVTATLNAEFTNSTASVLARIGIGYDSTTAASSQYSTGGYMESYAANDFVDIQAQAVVIPSSGRHYLSWLEASVASGTCTWFGNTCGLLGSCKA